MFLRPPIAQRLTLLFSVAMASSLPAVADEAQDGKTLPTITVNSESPRPELAPSSPRNAFRVTESSTSNTQTITREEIEQLRPRDVFELLNSATGVISTQGSRKGFSGLSIRGDSNFVWIVDGAYLQSTMASRIMRALPVMAIEEVKVVRGASALTMGPMVGSANPGGAPIDGFVIVSTRKPTKDEVQLRAAVESFDTLQGGAWLGKTFGEKESKAYVAGLLSYDDTNGSSEKLNNDASYNNARQSTGGLVKTGFTAAGWLVDLMAFKDEGTFQIPNANSHGSGQGSWSMDPSRTDIFVLSGSKAWNGMHTTLFNLSHSESKQTFWTGGLPVQNDNKVTHLNLRHNMDIDKTRIVLGGDYMHWNAPNGQQYYEGIQREEKTQGWFAQVEQKLLEDHLALDASYRRDRVNILHGLDYYTGGAQPFGGVNSPLKTTDKTLPAATFLSVGGRWKFIKDWKLTGRYGESEQASSGLNPAHGVILADDKQQKWEFGVEGQILPLFNPALNYFHREVKNEKTLNGYTYLANNGTTQTCRTGMIPATGVTAPRTISALTPCYTQADTTRDGVELSVNGSFGERSSYRASLTHFTQLSSVESTTPRHMADLSFSHGMGVFTLTGAAKYLSRYKGSSTDVAAYLGGYTRYDLGLGYDTKMGSTPIKTTLYGRNLSNKKYETSNGVQDVGRAIGVEMIAYF